MALAVSAVAGHGAVLAALLFFPENTTEYQIVFLIFTSFSDNLQHTILVDRFYEMQALYKIALSMNYVIVRNILSK